MELEAQKILVTGPAGQIAFPLAERLAKQNEVWGIARFRDAASRERCEKVGITTRAVDLADPDWGDLPDDFDYLLHLAAAIVPGHDFDASLRINAEGTGRVMSPIPRREGLPDDVDLWRLRVTRGWIGSGGRKTRPSAAATNPTPPPTASRRSGRKPSPASRRPSSACPPSSPRMNAAYGDNGGLPAMLVAPILAGHPIPLLPGHSVCSPIHEDDIYTQTAALLEHAAIPATITNWGGDEGVDMADLCRFIGELVGREPKLVESSDGIHQYHLDATRRRGLAGPCQVGWRDGVRRMIEARHPEALAARR